MALITKQSLLPPTKSHRKHPINLESSDYALFEQDLVRSIPPSYLLSLKDVCVTDQGVVLDGIRVVKESHRPKQKYGLSYIASSLLKKKVVLPKHEQYILAFDNWSNGYFHWFCDLITRLYSIKDYCNGSILILSSLCDNKNYLKTLEIFNFKEVFFIPKNSCLYVSNLLLPTHTAPTGNYNECLIKQVRSAYITHYSKKTLLNLGDKIYISRAKANKRKVLNEDQLMPILNMYGFHTVYLEDYDFEEQFSIIYNAKYLISIHGAGLTNILFMSPMSNVMEIRKNTDKSNLCYYSLASALDLNYYYVLGFSLDPGISTHMADINLTPKILEESLKVFVS